MSNRVDTMIESLQSSVQYWQTAIDRYQKLLEAVDRDPDQPIENLIHDIRFGGPAKNFREQILIALEYCKTELSKLQSIS